MTQRHQEPRRNAALGKVTLWSGTTMATYNHSPAKSSASSPAERGILGTISRLREIEAHLRASCADERIAVKVGNIAFLFHRLLTGPSADVSYLLDPRLPDLRPHEKAAIQPEPAGVRGA